MRPIDADGLKKSIKEDEKLKSSSVAYLLMNLMTCYIDEAPTIDAEPVKNGHWVEKEKYTFGIMYYCSLCENRILDNGHPWNYCPNCGAKMGEITNDE